MQKSRWQSRSIQIFLFYEIGREKLKVQFSSILSEKYKVAGQRSQ